MVIDKGLAIIAILFVTVFCLIIMFSKLFKVHNDLLLNDCVLIDENAYELTIKCTNREMVIPNIIRKK